MLQEGAAQDVDVAVLSRESALAENEVALATFYLPKVLLGLDGEHLAGQLKAYWFQLLCNGATVLIGSAKGLVIWADDLLRHRLVPLFQDRREHFWRNLHLRGARVNNSRERARGVFQRLSAIVNLLAL